MENKVVLIIIVIGLREILSQIPWYISTTIIKCMMYIIYHEHKYNRDCDREAMFERKQNLIVYSFIFRADPSRRQHP